MGTTVGMLEADIRRYRQRLRDIQDALNTNEDGEALVEVARNAHKAEMELASYKRKFELCGRSIDYGLQWARNNGC